MAWEARPKTERVWFNARSLDGELSIRRLRQRWPEAVPLTWQQFKDAAAAPARAARRLADEQRMAVWRSTVAALDEATGRLVRVPVGSPEWPAIARASADVLTRAALTAKPSGRGPVSRAADALARAAAPRRDAPPPAAAVLVADLGRVAEALLVAGGAGNGRDAALVLAVVVAAARLVTQLAELRRAQEQVHAAGAAQAAAARLLPLMERTAEDGILARAAAGPVVPAPRRQPVVPERPVPDRRERGGDAR